MLLRVVILFHLCRECPDKTELSLTLMTTFDSNEFDSTISYKKWVSTDRTTLVTIESTVNKFIDNLTDKRFELCHHHFIKVQQAARDYFKLKLSSISGHCTR